MPSPRRLTVTRAVGAVAAAALALALTGAPEPVGASPSLVAPVSASNAAPGSSVASDSNAASGASWPSTTSRDVARTGNAPQNRGRRSVDPVPAPHSEPTSHRGTWTWPVAGRRTVSRGYEAPASRYTAGHRGVDIPAVEGTPVVSPAAGSVRFAGVVVDRPTVTVQTGSGILISIEPLSASYAVGDVVMQGAPLGVVSRGGHCDGACIHLGVNGDYVSPMRFFGGIPRAMLLPIG